MLFPKLLNALEDASPIFDDCEGNGLRYDILTKEGYVNIQIDTEYTQNIITFDIFKVLGEPVTPENEDQQRIQEFGGYVSELDMDTGAISKVTLERNGKIRKTGDGDLVKLVLEEIEKRLA